MRHGPCLLIVLVACLLTGCQTHHPTSVAASPSAVTHLNDRQAVRVNALALLGDLMGDEKHLSLILIIKRESVELKRLVKDISETAGDGADLVKMVAEGEGLRLENLALPPGEVATRQAIAKTKKDALLDNKGPEFEFQILLTQAQALGYGTHLAEVIAQTEPLPDRARKFKVLSVRLKQLYTQTLSMLRAEH